MTDTRTWQRVETLGLQPCYAHSLHLIGSRLYLVGGSFGKAASLDLNTIESTEGC